jgi:outer membrane protein assembly factor BamB
LLFVAVTSTQAQTNLIAGQEPGIAQNGNQINSTAACDTIFSFPAVDTWTGGITYDGTYLWSGGYNTDYFYKHDLTGAIIDSVQNPSFYSPGYMGGDLDFDGTNILFFQEESDTLYKLDPTTGNLVSKFRIAPCGTNCYGVAFDGTHIWISNYSLQVLYKVDATTGTVLNSFSISTTSNMLPIEFINGKLYGLGVFPGMIYEMDTTSGAVLSTIPWCLGYSLGFCIADNHMWGSSSQLSVGGTLRIYQFDSLLLSNHSNVLSQTNEIEIYPNPSSGKATLSFEKIIKNGSIEITDILGKVIYTGIISDVSEMEISLQEIYRGVCFVKVFDGEHYHSSKLLVTQ